MLKTVDVFCDECDSLYIAMVEVPYGSPLPDILTCELCGAEGARRRISANIAKKEIEERTHGGELIGGKLVRRMTGTKAVKEQAQLRRQIKKAQREGDNATAQQMQQELSRKALESVKS